MQSSQTQPVPQPVPHPVSEPALQHDFACTCGSRRVSGAPVHAKDELGGAAFDYVRCAECGTERLSPRPPPEAIGGYYPAGYAAHTIRGESFAARLKRLTYLTFYAPENRLGWRRAPLRLLLWPLRGRSVLAFHPLPTRRVFEFGAATGNDLAIFREEGWQVSGCEPSPRAAAMAASRGIALQVCTAEAAVLEPDSLSCILLNNVLEHLHDPARVLTTCGQALLPGGALVLIIPNHACWSARLFGAAWPGYDAPRHLWGFSPKPLTALLESRGFRVAEIHHQFPGRWAWQSALDGRHAAAPVAGWRRRHARLLALALLPVGAVAAALGYGDFIKVVAYRTA